MADDSEVKPNRRGGVTKYDPVYVEQARKLAARGLIDREIADAEERPGEVYGGKSGQFLGPFAILEPDDAPAGLDDDPERAEYLVAGYRKWAAKRRR
jgi:hypothetical protein